MQLQMSRFFEANKVAAQELLDPPSPGDRHRGPDGGTASTAGPGRGDSSSVRRARVEAQSRAMGAELEQPSYIKMILSYEKNFDQLLRDFMGRLARNARVQYNSHLANLVMRLDYNGFFSSSAES